MKGTFSFENNAKQIVSRQANIKFESDLEKGRVRFIIEPGEPFSERRLIMETDDFEKEVIKPYIKKIF